MQSGTTGISGLTLAAVFGLQFSPFVISAGLALASREKPFALTVFVLGGGGFVEVGARYEPTAGRISCFAFIGVNASASLAISLGPIRGGVYVYLGTEISYEAGTPNAPGLAFGVYLTIRGEVDVLGIVSASIALYLTITYYPGALIARGRVVIKIKICWCFTLSVNVGVEYRIGCSPLHPHSLAAEGHHLPGQAGGRRPAPTMTECEHWADALVALVN
jgi:hypothetical protein